MGHLNLSNLSISEGSNLSIPTGSNLSISERSNLSIPTGSNPSIPEPDDRWQLRSYVTDEYVISSIKSTRKTMRCADDYWFGKGHQKPLQVHWMHGLLEDSLCGFFSITEHFAPV